MGWRWVRYGVEVGEVWGGGRHRVEVGKIWRVGEL